MLLALAGCSESASENRSDAGDGHYGDDACGVIATRCHPYAALPEAAMCHDLGHEPGTTIAECEASLEVCLAICPELDAGAPDASDAGSNDAAPGDAATEEVCSAYCECMLPTCGAQIGGNFADNASCMAFCAGFDAAESACWPTFCEAARAGSSSTHNCEHAAGELGLEECP